MCAFISGIATSAIVTVLSYKFLKIGIGISLFTGITLGLDIAISRFLSRNSIYRKNKLGWPWFLAYILLIVILSITTELNLSKLYLALFGYSTLCFYLGSLNQWINSGHENYLEVCVLKTERSMQSLEKELKKMGIPYQATISNETITNELGEDESIWGRIYTPQDYKMKVLNIISDQKNVAN